MIRKESDALNLTVQEYADVFPHPEGAPIDWTHIETKLHNEMEWTQEGATQVATLAREYGAFVLRNALALAVSLGVEDGELGY
ncbi:MAG: hypothetical protein ABSB91_04320 [Sedimentisphaerales bacterium]|jgi:hypothetical protein